MQGISCSLSTLKGAVWKQKQKYYCSSIKHLILYLFCYFRNSVFHKMVRCKSLNSLQLLASWTQNRLYLTLNIIRWDHLVKIWQQTQHKNQTGLCGLLGIQRVFRFFPERLWWFCRSRKQIKEKNQFEMFNKFFFKIESHFFIVYISLQLQDWPCF